MADADSRSHYQMAEVVAARTGIARDDIIEVLDAWFEAVGDVLAGDERVVIRGFGSFVPSMLGERTVNVPGKGKTAAPARRRVRFTPSPVWLRRVEGS